MSRRRASLAAAALLTATGVAFAHYPPRWVGHPLPVYVVPFDPCVCPPAPVLVPDCPPTALTPPAKPQNPPKVMEKSETIPPKVMEKTEPATPKAVKPAGAEEPMAEKPKAEKTEVPKSDLAIPSPAVPEAPVEKPKQKAPEPNLPVVPPLNTPPKTTIPNFELPPAKTETPAPLKLDLPATKTETPAPLKLDVPQLTLPASGSEPAKKPEETPLPPITLPKTSESKYTPANGEPKVRVIPVEGRRAAGNQTVNFYNYTARDLQLNVDGKTRKIPAKSLLAVILPDSFAWTYGEKSETLTIPTDAAGLSIIFQ